MPTAGPSMVCIFWGVPVLPGVSSCAVVQLARWEGRTEAGGGCRMQPAACMGWQRASTEDSSWVSHSSIAQYQVHFDLIQHMLLAYCFDVCVSPIISCKVLPGRQSRHGVDSCICYCTEQYLVESS